MTTLFISDLHLADERPEITQLFIQFLQQRASHADALYILGDLFEVWLGDDMVLPGYHEILSQMRWLTDHAIPLYIMRGNRDFLLGKVFTERTGAILLEDPAIITLYDHATLLMHGDTLCTDDIEYQKFRQMVRNPDWQREVLAKSAKERIVLAQKIRETSQQEMSGKTAEIMDVNQQAVIKAMNQNHTQQLIHGHTHRPAVHNFRHNNQEMRRIVLGDWYEQGSVLECNKKSCKLTSINNLSFG